LRVVWPALVLVAAAAAVGCGKKTVPQSFAGTYRLPSSDGSSFKEITVTSGGITFSGVSMIGSDSSVTFKSVSCESEASCSFATENRCDGSLAKLPNGGLVVTATFVCDVLAGKWLPEEEAKKVAATTATATASAATKAAFDPAALPDAMLGQWYAQARSARPELTVTPSALKRSANTVSGLKVTCSSATSCSFTGTLEAKAATAPAKGTLRLTADALYVDVSATPEKPTGSAPVDIPWGVKDMTNAYGRDKPGSGTTAAADTKEPPAARGGGGAIGCLAQCTADTLKCHQACGTSDVGCLSQCSATGAKCTEGCPQ
jgi:hypothetical protein